MKWAVRIFFVCLAIGFAVEIAKRTTEKAPDKSRTTVSIAPAPTLGRLEDYKGEIARYRSGPVKLPGRNAVGLCLQDVEAVRLFVLDGLPYAANGFTKTFSDRWKLTLEVDGMRQSIQEFEGAVGNVLTDIESLC